MNKITVLKERDQQSIAEIKTSRNDSEFPAVMEFLVEDAVEITDEEIEREACAYSEEAYLSYLACWNYIKSKIR